MRRVADETGHVYGGWDAEAIFGCVCDEGATGPFCEDFACPSGDDPMTTMSALEGTSPQNREEQVFRCGVDWAAGEDALRLADFRFGFLGEVSQTVTVATLTIASMVRTLSHIPGVGMVSVRVEAEGDLVLTTPETRICEDLDLDGVPERIAVVTFLESSGDVPPVRLLESDGKRELGETLGNLLMWATDGAGFVRGGDGVVVSSKRGGRERLECSGRGRCDVGSGECKCFDGFVASRGLQGDEAGVVQNCGHFDVNVAIQMSGVTNTSLLPGCPVGKESRDASVETVCSGHGECAGEEGGWTCACRRGWSGPACDEMLCPVGRAWFQPPTSADTAASEYWAHAPDAVCSGIGTCNRESGTCECPDGFTGGACQRSTCPTKQRYGVCSGHGRCLSMSELAEENVDALGDPDPFVYGRIGRSSWAGWRSQTAGGGGPATSLVDTTRLHRPSQAHLESRPTRLGPDRTRDSGKALPGWHGRTGNAPADSLVAKRTGGQGVLGVGVALDLSEWDDQMLHGCLCDEDWTGHDCSERLCPTGNDWTNDAVNNEESEEQFVDCERLSAASSISDPSIILYLRGHPSSPIRITNATSSTILEALPTTYFGTVEVSISNTTDASDEILPESTTPMCPSTAGETFRTRILFHTLHGDLPPIRITAVDSWDESSTGLILPTTFNESVKGTTIALPCSGHGLCDRTQGTCRCFPGWGSSNGQAQRGSIDDCGARSTIDSSSQHYSTTKQPHHQNHPTTEEEVAQRLQALRGRHGRSLLQTLWDNLFWWQQP